MQEIATENPLWSLKEVTQFLGISKDTCYRYIRSGKLPAVRVGTSIRIQEKDVLALVETVGPVSSTSEDRPTPCHDKQEAP